MWHVQVMGIVTDNCVLPLSMWYFVVKTLTSSFCCTLDIGSHRLGLHDMIASSLKDCLLFYVIISQEILRINSVSFSWRSLFVFIIADVFRKSIMSTCDAVIIIFTVVAFFLGLWNHLP
jgi:hypothetical protein